MKTEPETEPHTRTDPAPEQDETRTEPEPKQDEPQKPWHVRARERLTQSPTVDRVLAGTKTMLEVGSDAAEILADIGRDGLTLPGGAALTLRAVNTLRELSSQSPAEYFAEAWKPLSLRGMDDLLHEGFAAQPGLVPRPVPGTHDHQPAYMATLDGIEFGWAVSDLARRRRHGRSFHDDSQSRVEGAWIRVDQDELKALGALGRCVWKHLSSMRLLARNRRGEGISVVPEPNAEILPSRMGEHLYKKLQKALDVGIHRSVFLIGEPGVGKSCMLRYVASLHGGLQLRFKLADMQDLSGTQIADIIEILQPDVLLIDDFDRFVGGGQRGNQAHAKAVGMLDPLERINELVPLFVVSANYNEGITAALLRPGRFDEIIVMEGLEPELYRKMLPGAPDKLIQAIQRSKMPMSHVFELQKRAKATGWDWESARKELHDLAERSDRVVEINQRKVKRRSRKRSVLAGKSQRQKALWLEKRARRDEIQASRYLDRIPRLREEAQKRREQAEKLREKAEAAEKKAKEKAQKKQKAEKARAKAKKKAPKSPKKAAKKQPSKGQDGDRR